MMQTIYELWHEARQSMAERKLARLIDRSIRKLDRIENYAWRRDAIFAIEHEHLIQGLAHLREVRLLLSDPSRQISDDDPWFERRGVERPATSLDRILGRPQPK